MFYQVATNLALNMNNMTCGETFNSVSMNSVDSKSTFTVSNNFTKGYSEALSFEIETSANLTHTSDDFDQSLSWDGTGSAVSNSTTSPECDNGEFDISSNLSSDSEIFIFQNQSLFDFNISHC